jgi:lysozyme family protein
MLRIQKAANFIFINETGSPDSLGFTEHLHDRGGRTIAGISERFHKEWFDKIYAVKNDLDKAKEIYYQFILSEWWNPFYDKIDSELIAIKIADLSYLCGNVLTIKKLQSLLSGEVGIILKIDGVFGEKTLALLNRYIKDIGEYEVWDEFRLLMKEHFETRSTARYFLKGWLYRLNKLPC